MIGYIDSSVLLRVVLNQARQLAAWPELRRTVSSALIQVECLRTLDRMRLLGLASDTELARRRALVFDYVAELEIVEIDANVLSRASQPHPTLLGTLDAIHLATATLWQESMGTALVIATHDLQLGAAARASGFRVVGV
jgi:predicted nucleic acid-binding protein